MNITKVRLGKTKSTGNYGSVRLELEADIESIDRLPNIIEILKETIDLHLSNVAEAKKP